MLSGSAARAARCSGDPPVQQLGDRQRHRGARGLEDQVVGEGAVAQHLRRLELAPGLGDVERMRLEHRHRELGAELRAGQRGDAGQAQRLARQLAEPALDQRADRHRLRQAAAALDRRRAAREHQVLQRLEREHRIAAGVAQQRRRQPLGAQLGQADRLDQGGELRQVERLQQRRSPGGPLPRARRAAARRRRRARPGAGRSPSAARRASPTAPATAGTRRWPRRRSAGRRRPAPAGRGRAHRPGWRRRRAAAAAAAPRRPAPPRAPSSGSTSASSSVRAGAIASGCAASTDAQQARQDGVGDAGVAGPRLDGDDAGPAGAEILQQAALADAGLADQHERAPVRPGMLERLQLAVAADQARRPQQAGRGRRPPRRQRRGAALDRRQQLDRLGRGPGAELVLQALLEALEGGDRRRPVAAQVVQAHQPALAVLGQRIALDQALRVDQAARDRALVLAARGRGGQRRGASAPATAGAAARSHSASSGRSSKSRSPSSSSSARLLVALDPREALRQVGPHRLLQLQPGAAAEQRQPGIAAQAVEALAQAGVGLLRADRRPEHRRHPVGADRTGERDQAEQRRVLGRERDPALADHQAGRAEQAQLEPVSGRVGGRNAGGDGTGHAARVWCRRRRQATSSPGRAAPRRAAIRYRRGAVTARLPRGQRAVGEIEPGRHGADPAALHQLVFVVVGLGDLGDRRLLALPFALERFLQRLRGARLGSRS